MKTAAEVKPLLERALGYKPGELPLVNQERHVLLGSVAKQYLRDALSDAGVPMRSVKDVQGGDRVVILVAKSDMEKVINSKEFRTLMSKGATIFMPEGSQQFYREFMGAGYVAMPQPGTTVAWAPSVGFEGDSATRRYSKVVSLAKKQEEQRAKQQREFFDQLVGAVEDRMGPLTITKEEERQLIEEELAAFRTDTFEEKQKSISDMKDSIQMLRDSAAELRELKQEDLAQEQEGAVALMETILKEMESIVAGGNVVSLVSQMTGLSPELMDLHLRASIWENVGKTIGKAAANASKKKAAQWVGKQLAEGGSFDQINRRSTTLLRRLRLSPRSSGKKFKTS